MYKDIIAKIKFHKERVLNSFLEFGIYPNNEMLSQAMERIDTRTAYLHVTEANKGHTFNSEEHNAMIHSIFMDLELLYRLIHELTFLEYVKLQSYADTHLEDLEERVLHYKRRTEQESNATSLGKTIFFQNKNFHVRYHHDTAYVELGKIKLHKGSRVAAKVNGTNLINDTCFFTLKNEEQTDRFCPYNYNQDIYTVPGDLKKNSYTYSIEDNQQKNGLLLIDAVANPKSSNEYVILGGKNKILVKQFGEVTKTKIQNRPTSFNELGFDERSYIDFYVVGGKSISFKFNKKPVATNFSLENYRVDNLNYIHHFFIECDEDFAFSFELDGGEVYASKSKGNVDDGKLTYYNTIELTDFKVIEYMLDEPVEYELGFQVQEASEDLEIETVIIKELIQVGGEYNDSI